MLPHIIIVLLATTCTSFGTVIEVLTDKPLIQYADPIIQPTVMPIFELTYSLSDTKIVDFITDVVIDHPNRFNLDTAAILTLLNVTEDNLSTLIEHVDYKHFLQVIGVKITDIVWEVSKTFTDRTKMVASLQALGIDLNKYAEATAYADQELMFQILRSANFSKEAFEQVQQISGLTLNGIMGIIRPMLVNGMSAINIDKILIELEDDIDNFVDLIFANITLPDALANPVFAGIISNYTKVFNLHTGLVVPIGPHRLITLMDAVPIWEESKKYMNGHLVNIEDNSVVLRVQNVYLNCTYAVVEIDEINSSYFTRTEDYSTIPDACIYITQSADGLIEVRNATSSEISEYIITTDNEYFETPQFGSPLICDNLVYGLFAEESNNKLMFITLHDDMPDDWDGFDGDDDDDSPGGGSGKSMVSVALIFASFLPLFL